MTKTGHKKMLTHKHTGKIRHHKHTHYRSLFIVLLLTFIPVFSASHSIASAQFTDYSSGDYQTYAVVPGPTPTVAPQITNVSNGKTFTTSDPVALEGSCPNNTLVKVFKNEVFAGAVLCQNGSFKITIDLFVGNNSVIVRAYNTNDAVSPDSQPVSLTLALPDSNLQGTPQLNTVGAPAGQFYITSEITHKGGQAGETMTWPLTLTGGQAPYAVSISWGDGKTDLISRSEAGTFDISHVYDKSGGFRGSYTIVITSTDQAGAKSYLQLVAIVSGDVTPVGVVGSVKGGFNKSAAVKVAWELLGVAAVVVVAFWLGEKREEKVLLHPTHRIA